MPNAWNVTHILGAATTVVYNPGQTAGATAPAPMTVHSVLVNTATGGSSSVNVYDYNASGPPAGALKAGMTIGTNSAIPAALEMDGVFTVGIVVVTTGATTDVTVLWA